VRHFLDRLTRNPPLPTDSSIISFSSNIVDTSVLTGKGGSLITFHGVRRDGT
jgi:hypothetical protein